MYEIYYGEWGLPDEPYRWVVERDGHPIRSFSSEQKAKDYVERMKQTA